MPDELDRLRSALAGRYRIERRLGGGGMADVYLAEDLKHGWPVAIKVMRPDIASMIGHERFAREIEITGRLVHPHILPLHDSGVADGSPYYVTSYLEGATLRERLDRERQLPVPVALEITRQVARALSFAHARDVVHRDIKPSNILLQDGVAVVADFGIARALWASGGERFTETGVALGTVGYMSPEQIHGDSLDGRSDVYSLACVLYEMLAGTPPYAGPDAAAIAGQHLAAPVPDVTALRPSTPEPVGRALTKALAKNRADRFESAAAFAAALGVADTPAGPVSADPGAKPPVDTKGSTAVVPPAPKPPHPIRWVALWAAMALAVVAIAVWLVFMRPKPPPVVATRIVVLPFTMHGGDDASLGEGMVGLLGAVLDGAGDWQTVDPGFVLRWAHRAGGGPADPEVGAVAARWFGAGKFVLGEAFLTGDRLRLQARLYSASGDPEVQGEAEGSADSLGGVVDDLARSLIVAAHGTGAEHLARLATLTTPSTPALKMYLRGERALGEGDYVAAGQQFARAVEEDSSFALALYRMSQMSDLNGAGAVAARVAAERAVRHLEGLRERDRETVRGRNALLHGELDDAEGRFQKVLSTYPDDFEALTGLGYVAYLNPMRARPANEFRWVFEKIVALDPGNVDAADWLMWIAANEGRFADVDSIADLMDGRTEGLGRHFLHHVRVALTGTPEAQREAVAEMQKEGDLSVIMRNLTNVGKIETVRTLAEHAGLIEALTQLDVAQGRWRSARQRFTQARGGRARSVAFAAWWAATPLPDITAADRDSLRHALEGLPLTYTQPYLSLDGTAISPQLQAYLMGLLSARGGDTARALELAAQLEAPQNHGDAEARAAAPDFAATIRATLFLADGKPEQALAALDAAPMKPWFGGTNVWRYRTYARFLRAEALHAAGRDDEALRWYATYMHPSRDAIVFRAICHLRQAQILEARGRSGEAIAQYRSFLEYWKDADPELQPMVEGARARMNALISKAG